MSSAVMTDEELGKVRIGYEIHSPEPGGGSEKLLIQGDLLVRAVYQEDQTAEPKTREGRIPKEAVLRLLEMFEHGGFDIMEERIEENPHAELQLLSLGRGDAVRRVGRRGVEDCDFERLVGALKLAAALALPEVSQQTFFESL